MRLLLAGAALAVSPAALGQQQMWDSMMTSCVASAYQSAGIPPTGPSNPAVKQIVDSYCSCSVERTKKRLTGEELIALSANPKTEPAASKIRQVAQDCSPILRGQAPAR